MVLQTKVFVGSLPQGSKPEELRKVFERFGTVTECDILNRCGFVHMQSEEQATAAIRGLNNTTFNGAVISVERGRIKERGQRGGGGGRGGRGGMRGGMDRMGGGVRGAPYMRDARPPHVSHIRSLGAGPPRNGMGYERAAEPYDDRYAGYGGEDRRGFALMDRGPRDPYAAPAPVYPEDRYSSHISVLDGSRRGYGGGVEEMGGMYADERRAPPLYEERAMRPHPAPYDRAAPNGDMYSRRSPMRGGAGGYDRDPYAQQYPPMGRGGGGAGRGRELAGGMGPRRY